MNRQILHILIMLIILFSLGQARSYRFEFQKRVQPEMKPELLINNLEGNISVIGSTRDDIMIHAYKIVTAESAKDAEKIAELIDINLVQNLGQISISTKLLKKKNSSFFKTFFGENNKIPGQVVYKLDVPKNCRVDINSKKGNIVITNLSEDIYINSGHGQIALSEVTGDMILESNGGTINASLCKGSVNISAAATQLHLDKIDGTMKIKMTSGNKKIINSTGKIALEQTSGTLDLLAFNGDLMVSSGSGDVNVSQTSGYFNISSNSGDISILSDLKADDKSYINTTTGDISVTIPEKTEFDLRLESKLGKIECAFPLKTEISSSHKIIGRHGKGGPSLNLFSESGRIYLGM